MNREEIRNTFDNDDLESDRQKLTSNRLKEIRHLIYLKTEEIKLLKQEENMIMGYKRLEKKKNERK